MRGISISEQPLFSGLSRLVGDLGAGDDRIYPARRIGRGRQTAGGCATYRPRSGGSLRWYFTSLGDDIVHWWRRELPPIVRAEHSGRWLRLFVGLSAFNMGLSGIATSLVDRSAWPLWQQFIVLGGVSLSLIAAQGHLALAWARHPRRWRFYILASVLWMPVGFYIRWRFL